MKKIIYLLIAIVLVATSCEKEENSIELMDTDYINSERAKNKVDVCHYDARDNIWKVINVSENAVNAHLNHGDYLGICSVEIDGLIAYYPFNGNANDESNYDNHGSVNGASLTLDRFGNENSAYSFDGVNDFIQVPSSSENNLGIDDFTLLVWFRSNDNDEGVIWNKRNTSSCSQASGPTTGFSQSSLGSNNRLKSRTRSSSDYILYSENTISDGNWHQGVLKREGNNLFLYLDSILEESVPISPGIDFSTTLDLFIGKSTYCSGNHYNGDIDDFTIYNRALTISEIEILYNQ